MIDICLESDITEIGSRLKDVAARLSGKTILLSGGRGFLGRYFCRFFAHINENILYQPCNVIILDNLVTSSDAAGHFKERPNFKFINHNIITPFKPDCDIDYVIHLAGVASPSYYSALPIETLEVAITGTRNMLEIAESTDARMTFFSSSEIYGDPHPDSIPTPETYRGNVACQGPRACYDESKRVGETLCHIFHEYHGVHTNVIRPFNVYGPGMLKEDYRVLPNFASRIKDGLPLKVYGTGNQTRTFCYIVDSIVGFMRVVINGGPGETYNIGNPEPEVSMLELVENIRDILGDKVLFETVNYPDDYPADEPNRRCPDINKAQTQLGFAPQITLDVGLSRFLNWADKAYDRSEHDYDAPHAHEA